MATNITYMLGTSTFSTSTRLGTSHFSTSTDLGTSNFSTSTWLGASTFSTSSDSDSYGNDVVITNSMLSSSKPLRLVLFCFCSHHCKLLKNRNVNSPVTLQIPLSHCQLLTIALQIPLSHCKFPCRRWLQAAQIPQC